MLQQPIGTDGQLAVALSYASGGWSILPVEAGTKQPPKGMKWKRFQSIRATEDQLQRWFDPASGGKFTDLAVVLGPVFGGLGNRDFDKGDAYDLWAEEYFEWARRLPTVRTSRGAHVYFRLPQGSTLSGIKSYDDGELRISGGIALLPPSRHPSGQIYEWIVPLSDGEIPEVDPAEIGLIGKKSTVRAKRPRIPDRIPEGERNDTLTRIAGCMRRDEKREDEICARLLDINATRCKPPLEESEVTGIARSVAQYPAGPSSRSREFHHTELGNARRLVARHGQDLRYAALAKKWYAWNGRLWVKDETGKVYRRAKETIANIYSEASELEDSADRKKLVSHAMRSESEKQIRAMITLAQSESAVAITPETFDTPPWLLNCANGTIDLRTGDLKPHCRGHYITNMIPMEYLPDAVCPRWDAFLQRITNEDAELQAYLKRAVGYSLTGDASEQVMFILFGTGQNGKSKFLEVLRLMLGPYALHTPTKTLVVKPFSETTNDLARLYGARLVTAVEWEEGQRIAESLIKQVTGGDPVTVRFLHKEFFEFVPTFKLFLATNHKPPIRDTNYAMWRRIHMIEFLVTISDNERNKQIVDTLRPVSYPESCVGPWKGVWSGSAMAWGNHPA